MEHIIPDSEFHCITTLVGTIPVISNHFTFMWPTGENEGIIEAYEIPNYGKSKIYSVSDIKNFSKTMIYINQPNSIAIDQTTSEVRSKLQEKILNSSGANKYYIISNDDLKNLLHKNLISGFALRSKQKFGKKGGKRLNLNAIEKLKEMFLAGNIEKSNKFSPEDMLKQLEKHAENNEIKS
ncbi:9546_t:CDS:2 [Entrophospora sp. SA101]|nr:9546_t:CDS:2 [Entrophospora sp. SA101]